MNDLTDAKITKEFKESLIQAEIVKTLKKADKGLTLLEIRKSVDKANGKLLKELEKDGIVKRFNHYLHNSNKQFRHPETKKVDTIKGTLVHKYKLIDKED